MTPSPCAQRAALTAALLSGCQIPYGPDRHDVAADRIVAITRHAASTADRVTLRAQVAVGGHLWQDEPVSFAWYPLLDGQGPDDVDPTAAPTALGPSATLPSTAARWALIAYFPSGTTWRAEIASGPDLLPAPTDLTVGELPLSFTAPEEGALELDAREALTPVDPTLTPSRWYRLTATWSGPDAADARPATLDRVRWMTTAPRTTFLELDDVTTDWATGLLTLDDGEVEAATPGVAGPATILALALDGSGANALAARDLWLGAAPKLAWMGARALTAPAGAAPGSWDATLQADDASPTGLTVTDLQPPSDGDLPAPACTGGVPFHPDHLLDGRCLRPEVIGAVVRVEVL
jgi:hypothetical protein